MAGRGSRGDEDGTLQHPPFTNTSFNQSRSTLPSFPQFPHKILYEERILGNSLAIQRLGLCAFTGEGPGANPDQRTKIPQAVWRSQKQVGNVEPITSQRVFA